MKKFLLLGALTIWGLKRSRSIEDKSRTVNKSTTKIARQNLVFWIAGSAVAAVTLTIVGVMVYWDRKKKLKASFPIVEKEINDKLEQIFGKGRLRIHIQTSRNDPRIKIGRKAREMLQNYDENLIEHEDPNELYRILTDGQDIYFYRVKECDFFISLQANYLLDEFRKYLFIYSEMNPDFKGEWTQEQFDSFKILNMKNSRLSEEAKRKITKKFDTLILKALEGYLQNKGFIKTDIKTFCKEYKKAQN